MDLYGDLRKCILTWFLSANVDVGTSLSTDKLLERFLNTQLKLIRPQTRQVFISDTIQNKILDPSEKLVLDEIKSEFENGRDVCPHLSKGSLDIEVNDGLLNDWGIYHLHLSNTKRNPSQYFFDRTGPVLFVRVEFDKAYFIDIRPHGHSGEAHVFAKQELLETWERNWPDSIEHYALRGLNLSTTYTDREVKTLRNGGVCAIMQVNGKAYAPMGGGITSAGTNVQNRMRADQITASIHELEEQLRILKQTRSGEYHPPVNFDFFLDLGQYKFIVTQLPERINIDEIPF